MKYDYCVIGGGIVGLATARELLRRNPGKTLILLEKEAGLARHQTGRNSGVIHAGVYYAPGSLKARLCRLGEAATKIFCEEHGVRYRTPGKIIVATDDIERTRLTGLAENARINGLDVEELGQADLREREPNITGVAGLLVPSTGIVDYAGMCGAMASEIIGRGAEVRLETEVAGIAESISGVTVSAAGGCIVAGRLVVCAGLQADRMVEKSGRRPDFQIVPFRGEYFELSKRCNDIVRHLVYPVPQPGLPFLGIHLTPMIDGTITVGPNAILGLSRENYNRFPPNLADIARYLGYRGFWKLIRANLMPGVSEVVDAMSKWTYLKKCRKYCPSLELSDLMPRRAGIRAQAVDGRGNLVHDFLFDRTERVLHVCNAPSPAATAALPIADMIVDRLSQK